MATSSMLSRVQKLELGHNGRGRCIVLRTGSNHTERDVRSFLLSQGIVETPCDQIVCLNTIFMDRNDQDIPSKGPPVLLSVSEMK